MFPASCEPPLPLESSFETVVLGAGFICFYLSKSNFPDNSTALDVHAKTKPGYFLRSSFVNDVEWCFRSAPEAFESGRGHDIPNSCLARLRTQAQPYFL